MQMMNLAELLNISDEKLREVVLQAINANDYRRFFYYLHPFGHFEAANLPERQKKWHLRTNKLRSLVDMYPMLAPFVQAHYGDLDGLVQQYEGWQLNFWGVMHELCASYLASLGCACGKPYNVERFDEDYTHLKCESYKKWAWAHLPVAMRRNCGVMV